MSWSVFVRNHLFVDFLIIIDVNQMSRLNCLAFHLYEYGFIYTLYEFIYTNTDLFIRIRIYLYEYGFIYMNTNLFIQIWIYLYEYEFINTNTDFHTFP